MMDAARHRWIPLSDRHRWTAALDGIAHDVGHRWDYCHALARSSAWPVALYVFEEGDVRIVCPFQERTFGGYHEIATPPGFSGFVGTAPHERFPDRWAEHAADRGFVCGYVGLHPVLGDPSYANPAAAAAQNSVYLLDLDAGIDALVASLNRNRRRELRDWPAPASRLVDDRDRLTAFLVREYPGFLESVDASPSYARSAETLEAVCALDDTLVLGTEHDGRIDSVYVVGYTRTIGTALFHVALPTARAGSAALVWQGVHLLRDRGVRYLNLGGGIREDDSIATAKQRFGSRRVPLRALRQVYRPELYEKLCREAGVDPDDGGFFPAYRAGGRTVSAV